MTEPTTEKEIVINLDNELLENVEQNDGQNDNKNIEPENIEPEIDEQPKPKTAAKFVERKQVVDLTDDERALIVANARNGLDQPNFDVKFFKNGKYRILKKKEQPQTVAQKIVNNASDLKPQKEERKIYYSDNQILFEHILELNSKVDRLMNKHKKLKRRYQTLQNDIYAEDEEVADSILIPDEPAKNEPDGRAIRLTSEQIKPQLQPQQQILQQQPQQQKQVLTKRMNWRSQLNYL